MESTCDGNLRQLYAASKWPAAWEKIPPISPRLPELLDHCAKHFGDRELIVHDGDRVSYAEIIDRSAHIARQLLSAGVGKASRIGLLLPNGPEFLAVWFAIGRIGAIAVPISTLSAPAELSQVLVHADIGLLIAARSFLSHDYVEKLGAAIPELESAKPPLALPSTPFLRSIWFLGKEAGPDWADALEDVQIRNDCSLDFLAKVEEQVHPSDPLTVIYTSGSTAEPKGVIHSHGTLLREAAKLAAYSKIVSTDRVYSPQQFFWVGGLTYTVLRAVFIGAAVVVSTKKAAALLDVLERERVSFVVCWPHQARALAADPTFAGRSFPHMRGGELYEAIPSHLRTEDPGLTIMPLGMTETAGPHGIIEMQAPAHLRGTCGVSMPGVEYMLVDPVTGQKVGDEVPGVLLLRSDTLFTDMVKRERSSVIRADGWYDTRDLCRVSEGHLFFLGRVDDLIKVSGANVSPLEVERVLISEPRVAKVAVVGVPCERRGHVVGAWVEVKDDCSVTSAELRQLAVNELSSFKVPQVIVVDRQGTIPTQHTGKVDKRVLQARLSMHFAAQS